MFEGCVERWECSVGVGIGGVTEGDVVAAGEAGLVDDGKACGGGEVLGEDGHGPVEAAHLAGTDVGAEAGEVIGFGGSEVGVGFRDEQSVSADGTGFGVGYEMKALLEKILQTGPKLFAGEGDAVFGLGVDVEVGGVEPGGWVGDLAAVDAVGQLDKESEGDVGCGESTGAGKAPATGVGVSGSSGFDGGDFEGGVLGLRGEGWRG